MKITELAEKMGKPGHPETGSVLLLCLMVLLLLTIIGFSSMHSSDIELGIAGNDRVVKRDFFNAESAMAHAIANFRKSFYDNSSYADLLKNANPDVAEVEVDSSLKDANDKTIARLWIHAVTNVGHYGVNTDIADIIPDQAHVCSPPEGFDATTYRGRRFSVTAVAKDPNTGELTNTMVNGGAVIAEELEKVEHLIGVY